jgi:hypothetical protein
MENKTVKLGIILVLSLMVFSGCGGGGGSSDSSSGGEVVETPDEADSTAQKSQNTVVNSSDLPAIPQIPNS